MLIVNKKYKLIINKIKIKKIAESYKNLAETYYLLKDF